MKWLFYVFFLLPGFVSSQTTLGNKNDIEYPSPASISEYMIRLENRVDSLSNVRSLNINNLMRDLSNSCLTSDSDIVIVRLVVNPLGGLDSFELIESEITNLECTVETTQCVQEVLSSEDFNLGDIEVVPNARNGTKPSIITYSRALKK